MFSAPIKPRGLAFRERRTTISNKYPPHGELAMGIPAPRGEIENRVLAVLREILALDGDPIGLDASIVEDLCGRR